MKQAVLFHLRGRVQGVYFRASTREQAMALGLAGHALNLPDGRVQVLAVGEPDALGKLERWLWQGPIHADVQGVERQDVELPDPAPVDFVTG